MKCDHAVQLCTCCVCGYAVHTTRRLSEVFLQATETGPNTEKNFTSRQTLKNAENTNWSSSNGFDPNLMTMMTLSAGFSATLCRTSSLL